MKFTRRNQLWLYVFLSAFTALCQYVIQGAMASGHNPAQFPGWFWVADFVLWGLRALIEAGVIVYLFSTSATNRKQGIILATFEIALIALITPTVGFALRGLGYGLQTREMLPEPWLTFWFLGIGAYTSLMMGAAGYAYRVQPDDANATAPQAALVEMQAELEAMRQEVAAVRVFAALPQPLQVKLITVFRNGAGPTNAKLAELCNVNESTISRWTNAKK